MDLDAVLTAPRELKDSPEKRVRLQLVADSGYGAMTGIDDRVRRQREQLAADAVEQQLAIATGKIETADAAPEQHVAAEHPARRAAIHEHDMPRRVARHVVHLELDARHLNHVSFVHGAVGGRTGDRHSERPAQIRLRIRQHHRIARADDQRRRLEKLLSSGHFRRYDRRDRAY